MKDTTVACSRFTYVTFYFLSLTVLRVFALWVMDIERYGNMLLQHGIGHEDSCNTIELHCMLC